MNDDGRRVIALVIGADLVQIGIPAVSAEEASSYSVALREADLPPIDPRVGFWNSVELETLSQRFNQLALDEKWKSVMFI